jgi:hypothetical protein
MENPQNSFILYTDSVEEVQLLTMEQRGLLLTTAFCYVNGFELPELDQATSVLWQTWKKNIDRNAEKWEATRQRRSAAGRKGGLAARRQSEANASNGQHGPPGQAVTVTDTVTGTGTVTDTVTVIEKGSALASPSEANNSHSILLPLKNGSNYVVTVEDLENYAQRYPMLDVPQVFQNILGWLESHPDRLKSDEDARSFVSNWLDRDASKTKRKEAYHDAGNADKADLSSLDHFGTVL